MLEGREKEEEEEEEEEEEAMGNGDDGEKKADNGAGFIDSGLRRYLGRSELMCRQAVDNDQWYYGARHVFF